MMKLTQAQLAKGLGRISEVMPQLEQQLNAADSRLGDGDTGTMLARVIGAMEAADPGAAASVSEGFSKMARAAMSVTGSSLGTLLAGALLTLSKACRDHQPNWEDLPGLINLALDGMMVRGGASLGDKTVLDALAAVIEGTRGCKTSGEFGPAAGRAARQALNEFRSRPCLMGRAKFYADKSCGLDDPGMLAVAELCAVLAEGERTSS